MYQTQKCHPLSSSFLILTEIKLKQDQISKRVSELNRNRESTNPDKHDRCPFCWWGGQCPLNVGQESKSTRRIFFVVFRSRWTFGPPSVSAVCRPLRKPTSLRCLLSWHFIQICPKGERKFLFRLISRRIKVEL